MQIQYKRIPFEVKEVVDVASGGWEIAGYASTFGGEPDFYGDVIARGAFAKSISSTWPKFLYEHHEPIGKTLEIREDDRGLFGKWSIVDTHIGTDAYKLAKAGVLDSLSIGYFTIDAEFRPDGVRVLREIELMEVSAVAIPANPNAIITDVKSAHKRAIPSHTTSTSDGSWDGPAAWKRCPPEAAKLRAACAWVDPDGDADAKSSYKFIHHEVSADGEVGSANLTACSTGIGVLNGGRGGTVIPDADRAGVYRHLARHLRDADQDPPSLKSAEALLEPLTFEDHVDDVQVAVIDLVTRARLGVDLRVKEGRAISEARRTRMASVSGSLRQAAEEIDAMLEETAPPDKSAPVINVAAELRRRRYVMAGVLAL